MLFEISQNSLENAYVRVSFLIKLHFFHSPKRSRKESVKYEKLENHLLCFTQNNAYFNIYRSSYRRSSIKKGVLRNFAKFSGKYLCQSLFLNKVAGVTASNYIAFVSIIIHDFFSKHPRDTQKNVWIKKNFFSYDGLVITGQAKLFHRRDVALH